MSYSKKCKIRILDEVNCLVVGLHPDHVGYFYEEFGRKAPKVHFNPLFSIGQWDGFIRYFHKTGKTYVYLLDEIIPRIIALGYKIAIEDTRVSDSIDTTPIDEDHFSHIEDPETGEPWKMRPYQIECINKLMANGGGVGIAGTGAGKTAMCAALADSYEKAGDIRTVIIVPQKSLNEQTRDEYAMFGLDVGEYSGDRKDMNHKHIVTTWQALQRNGKLLNDFGMVIVDECQGLKGKVLTELLTEFGKNIPYRFGVTGTLPKEETDAMAIRIAVGEVQFSITASELIKQGYLAKLHIDILQLEVDLKDAYESFKEEWKPKNKLDKVPTYRKFKDSYFAEWADEKRFMQTEKERVEWIAEYLIAKRDFGRGNVFCLVDGIRFGQKLQKLIPNSFFVHGKDRTKARREVYDLFKENDDLIVIATVHIAGVGLNIKRIFSLVFIDMGRSFIRVIQTIGRGLRKAPDKDFVSVTDICSDLKHSRSQVRDRIKFYKEAEYPHKKRTITYGDE